jgi:predicted transposase YbfD/YdcC
MSCPPSLMDCLATVPDPRSAHGRFHPLSAVLGLVTLAMLLGRTSLTGIARFGRQHGTPLAHALGFRRGKTPSVSTLSRTLRRLDPVQLEAMYSRWIASRVDATAFEQISLDGKVLTGSRDGEVPGCHLLAAYAHTHQAVLAQVRVEATTNEHKAALTLLGLIDVEDQVLVGDAIFCQRDLAAQIIENDGDYVLIAKENQKTLAADVAAGFGFQAAADSIAAATSPSAPTDAARARANRHECGEKPWTD